jgi:ABC-type phosphate transport system permease subunit
MIKKQQKWIALLLTLTFMWLMQVSTMPVAASAPEQLSSASAEQGPDYYEAVVQKPAPAKKKSILPYVLIGVGVVAVAAVLFLVVLKPKYDITGSWSFVFTGPTNETHVLIFTGTKASGNYSFPDAAYLAGTYTVDGKNVALAVTSSPAIQFSGQFTDKDIMSGTYKDGANSWTWTASR